MNKHYYLRTASENVPAELSGITNALNSPALTDEDKQSMKTLLGQLGYKSVDVQGETKVYPPREIFDTWAIRAESKKLIAQNTLEDIVRCYENKEISQLYNEGEVAQIIDLASTLDVYKTNAGAAVQQAYIAFIVARKNCADTICAPVFKTDKEEKEE